MSGSNALAAAKRRRVNAIEPNKTISRGAPVQNQRINPQSAQRVVGRPSTHPMPQPPPQQQGRMPPPPPGSKQGIPTKMQNVKIDVNNFTNRDSDSRIEDYSQLPESSRFFMIPPLTDKPISHLQLLAVIHRYFNKLAYHLPNAVDTLGTNFNLLSSNCDNLNDRLEALEGEDKTNPSRSGDQLTESLEEISNLKKGLLDIKNELQKNINELRDEFRENVTRIEYEINSIKESLIVQDEFIEDGSINEDNNENTNEDNNQDTNQDTNETTNENNLE
jgi:hypothetical protein